EVTRNSSMVLTRLGWPSISRPWFTGPCFQAFARPVTITPIASQPDAPPYAARGIFDTERIKLETLEGEIFSETHTTLDILEFEFPILPLQDDRLSIPFHEGVRCQSRFRHSLFILQLLALLSLPTLCNSILLIFDNSRQCSDVMVASGSAATLSEYELRSLQRASHSSKPKKASLSIVRMT